MTDKEVLDYIDSFDVVTLSLKADGFSNSRGVEVYSGAIMGSHGSLLSVREAIEYFKTSGNVL